MAVTVADIRTRFPEFGPTDTATIDRWLAEAGRNHNSACWGDKSDDGLAWLTAHFLVAFAGQCTTDTLGPGPLTATAEAQVSASWSPLTVPKLFAKNDLGTTKYGRRYLSLLDTVFCCRCT